MIYPHYAAQQAIVPDRARIARIGGARTVCQDFQTNHERQEKYVNVRVASRTWFYLPPNG
jgi:hypothetical protein